MSKIFNNRLKGKQLATSGGKIQFNAEGVAEIANEELVEKLLGLKGYSLVEDTENPVKNPKKEPDMVKSSDEDEKPQEEDENTSDEEDAEGVAEAEYTEESLMEKNVPQLKKVAKDNNIDLAGATKKDEIIAIILGAMNN